jgi:hypothetical protein
LEKDMDTQTEEQRIREWFKDHIAEYSLLKDEKGNTVEYLNWGKPETGVYRTRYLFTRGTLAVWGDVADAIYQWHTSVGNMSALQGLGLDYFAGKCVASPHGRGYKIWDHDEARACLPQLLKDSAESIVDDTEADLKRRFEREDGPEALEFREAWLAWLNEHGDDFFGSDYYEYASDIGVKIDLTCHAHLIGLKMAFEQLAKREASK